MDGALADRTVAGHDARPTLDAVGDALDRGSPEAEPVDADLADAEPADAAEPDVECLCPSGCCVRPPYGAPFIPLDP
jgi:hypothetical protein